ncbi:MAG: hypothetical protein ABII13_02990, partial [Patescibacteria group bacterium]
MDKVRAFLKCVMSEDQIESQISSDLLVEFYTRDLEGILNEYEKLIGSEKKSWSSGKGFVCYNYALSMEEVKDLYFKSLEAKAAEKESTFFCPNESQVCITRKNGKIVGLAIMKCRHCGRNILVSH